MHFINLCLFYKWLYIILVYINSLLGIKDAILESLSQENLALNYYTKKLALK